MYGRGGWAESAEVVEETIAPAVGPLFKVKRVVVTVNHTFTILGPFATLVGGTFGTITMTAKAVMRTELASGGI